MDNEKYKINNTHSGRSAFTVDPISSNANDESKYKN